MSLIFEWDPRKAAANVGKHGIEFAEAIAVFDDPLAKIFRLFEDSCGANFPKVNFDLDGWPAAN